MKHINFPLNLLTGIYIYLTILIKRLFYSLFISDIMELFILFGGCYALYNVGIAIASHLDYLEVNK